MTTQTPAHRAELGRALAAQGRHAEAEREFRHAVRLEPGNQIYRGGLGRALAAQGRHAEAERQFREATGIDPGNATYQSGLGRVLAAQGLHAEAAARFRAAMECAPGNPGHQADLGRSLAAQGQHSDAEKLFRNAVELDPGSPLLRADLGRSLAAQGQHSDAEKLFRNAVELDPGNPAYQADLGRTLVAQVRFAEAETAFRQAAELDPGNPVYQAALGRALGAQARHAEAAARFREAIRLDPSAAIYKADHGRALAAQAQFTEAQAVFRHAMQLDPGNPAYQADLGRALAAQARFAEAEAVFRQAVQLDPGNPAYQADLGRALLSQKRLTDADIPLREAVRLDPRNPAYLADLGQASLSRGRHPDAEKLFREAVRLDPASPAYRAGLGRALSAQGRYAQAERLFREAVGLDQGAAEYRADLGRSLSAAGRHPEAERLFREAVRLDPASPAYRAELGRSVSAEGRYPEAEKLFRDAIRLDPTDPAFRADLGHALAAQGRHVDAENALLEAVRLDPTNAGCLADLGRSLAAQGRQGDAGQAFRQAAQLDPTNPTYHADLGHALAAQDRHADAGASYRQAAQLDPTNPTYHADLGHALAAQDRHADAEDALSEAVRLDPADAAYRADLGRSISAEGRTPEAEKLFREAVRLDPTDPAYQSYLGRALAAQGRHSDAEDALREAVRLHPTSTALRADLGKVLLSRQQIAQAESILREALQLDPDVTDADVADLQRSVSVAYDAAIVNHALDLAGRSSSKAELQRLGVEWHQYIDYIAEITAQQLSNLRTAYRTWSDAQSTQQSSGQRKYFLTRRYSPRVTIGLCLLVATAAVTAAIFFGDQQTLSKEVKIITAIALIAVAVTGFSLPMLHLWRTHEERFSTSRATVEEDRLTTLITNFVLEPAITAALQITWQDSSTDRVSVRNGPELSTKTEGANLITTEANRRLATALSRRYGAAVGVAGPRGSGKTELARMFTERPLELPSRKISLMLQAPTEYDAHTFLLRLVKELCIKIIDTSATRRDGGDQFLYIQDRRLRSRWRLSAGGLISLGLVVLLINISGLKASVIAPFAIGGSLIFAGIAILFTTRSPRTLRSSKNASISQQTVELAAKLRTRVEFTESYTRDTQLGISGYGLTASATKGAQFARVPLNEIDVVRELRDIVKSVAADRWQVVIAIDELDKMHDTAEAMKFLNHLKVLFPINDCSFIVSVSGDAWARFVRRGLPFRDAFDSSFDEVVLVEMLNPSESRDFLKRRNISITDAQALLCHCLSGGLPRDLLEAARHLASVADRLLEDQLRANGKSKPPLLCDVLKLMLQEDLTGELKASNIRAMDGIQEDGVPTNRGDLTHWFDIWPDSKETERHLGDICKIRDAAPITDFPHAVPSYSELEAYIAVLHTIREAFSPGGPLVTLELKSSVSDQLIADGFDRVARAHRCLANDIDGAWRFVHGARKALELAPLGTPIE